MNVLYLFWKKFLFTFLFCSIYVFHKNKCYQSMQQKKNWKKKKKVPLDSIRMCILFKFPKWFSSQNFCTIHINFLTKRLQHCESFYQATHARYYITLFDPFSDSSAVGYNLAAQSRNLLLSIASKWNFPLKYVKYVDQFRCKHLWRM